MEQRTDWLTACPDVPRYVETRSMLLDPESRLRGEPGGGVIIHPRRPFLACVGSIDPEMAREEAEALPANGELVADARAIEILLEALPGWVFG